MNERFEDINKVPARRFDEIHAKFITALSYELQENLGMSNPRAESIANVLFNSMYNEELHYHTPVHILEIFDFVDENKIDLTPAQALAIWFHDAIYDAKNNLGGTDSNKQLSSLFAFSLLSPYVSKRMMTDIEFLIEETQYHLNENVHTMGADLVLDLDLYSFAMSDLYFIGCGHAIADEYRHVTYDAYNKGRLAFFKALNAKASIYRTPLFKEKFEATARENIEKEILYMELYEKHFQASVGDKK